MDIGPIGGGGLSHDASEAGAREAAARLGLPGLAPAAVSNENKGGESPMPINDDGDGKGPNDRKAVDVSGGIVTVKNEG